MSAVDFNDSRVIEQAMELLKEIQSPRVNDSFLGESARAAALIEPGTALPDGRPSRFLQAAIPAAVHHGITTHILKNHPDTSMSGKCAVYAMVTAELCSAVFDKPYDVVAGSLDLPVNADGDRLQLRPQVLVVGPELRRELPRLPGDLPDGFPILADYHAICAHWHPDGQWEAVDSASRHYADLARTQGLSWARERPPSSSWTMNGLRMDAVFAPDPISTSLTRAMFESSDDIAPICDIAMHRLTHLLEREGWRQKFGLEMPGGDTTPRPSNGRRERAEAR